jgi:8-oxo-dGTP diphosphatase
VTGIRPPAITVRVCAGILNGDEICLIHRARPEGDQHSLPGGLVHQNEAVPAALSRELKEELDLDLTSLPRQPELRWVQDHFATRPGSPEPFRRLHLIHLLHLPDSARQALATTEQDAPDRARVVWVSVEQAARLHLYPAVGDTLATLTHAAGINGPVLLPPATDRTYNWR